MRRYLDAKWLSLVGFNLILVVMVCVHKTPIQSQVQDLSSLESRLKAIESKLNQPVKAPDLSPINQNLQQLGRFIQQLNNKDDHQLGELFSTGQVALKKQLDGISELLNKLDEQKHPVKTLPSNALPFQVLSIDSIQEVDVASVAYDFKTQALELGDSLAGWTVVHLDFAKQVIEFENQDKTHVHLNLNSNGVAHG
jgi:hydrogenase maturation factor